MLQLVAFVDDHVRVDDSPTVMVAGNAPIATEGGGGGGGGALTVTESPEVALVPVPGPVHVITYVYVPGELRMPVDAEPLVGFAPLHAPDAEQLTMLLPLHVIVAAFPVSIEFGDTRSETDGTMQFPSGSITHCGVGGRSSSEPSLLRTALAFAVEIRANRRHAAIARATSEMR